MSSSIASLDRSSPVVFVDAENVRRSAWPNVSRAELVGLVEDWAAREGVEARVVFEGKETADDRIAREPRASSTGYWLVTSDRGLRERAGGRAERVIGGGSFLRELRGGVAARAPRRTPRSGLRRAQVRTLNSSAPAAATSVFTRKSWCQRRRSSSQTWLTAPRVAIAAPQSGHGSDDGGGKPNMVLVTHARRTWIRQSQAEQCASTDLGVERELHALVGELRRAGRSGPRAREPAPRARAAGRRSASDRGGRGPAARPRRRARTRRRGRRSSGPSRRGSDTRARSTARRASARSAPSASEKPDSHSGSTPAGPAPRYGSWSGM